MGDSRAPLPSLNALLAFESAARHGSFTRAAKELKVTQTAVSHQIKSLEAELGVSLFRRLPGRLELTREGQAWAAELSVVFQRLYDANDKLRRVAAYERQMVAISSIPSFCARWLVPRLGKFMALYPDIDVRISATEALVDFSREPFDLGIRYGSGGYTGLVSEKLYADHFVLVCNPALHRKRRRWLANDLLRETLITDDHPTALEHWLTRAGLRDLSRARCHRISDSSMLVEAAIRGQGMALARFSLAADELAAGHLVLPFPEAEPLPSGFAYYLVGPRENLRRPCVARFRDWIREQVQPLLEA
ncbi:MAG TPA: transcriptional regulator GcvA [Polyangiaceae bacterium]|nr:transcriptional regulator GcvA [Polyangiaceae bacterium]